VTLTSQLRRIPTVRTNVLSRIRTTAVELVLLCCACARTQTAPTSESANPPAPDAQSQALPSASVATPPEPAPKAASDASDTAAETKAPPSDEPVLSDDAGRPLPQTEDKPSVATDRFRRRMELVARAILEEAPELALPAFFPVVAYQQVKDIQKPERDWKLRLVAAFERDVHEYHRALGRDAAQAKFLGVEVPEQQARWMKPGSEGNKVGYFRVLRSRLRFAQTDGKERTFELTSMISWRGEWYVVHLHGFE